MNHRSKVLAGLARFLNLVLLTELGLVALVALIVWMFVVGGLSILLGWSV